MGLRRAVPVITVDSLPEAIAFHQRLTGAEVVMDHGWIATLADPGESSAQYSLMTRDATASVNPALSIEVDDVDAAHAEAVTAGVDIVHPLTDEPWGVRRFFLRDPAGTVINVLGHHRGNAQ